MTYAQSQKGIGMERASARDQTPGSKAIGMIGELRAAPSAILPHRQRVRGADGTKCAPRRHVVTMLSSLPPQRGVTPYTVALLGALSRTPGVEVEALGFRGKLYPSFAYPGGDPDHGATVSVPVRVRRILAWYSPLSWILAGLTVRGRVLHAQWWSWFLAPAYAVVLTLARLRGAKLVVTVHNAEPHDAGRIGRVANTIVLRLADQLIVHSERNRAALIRNGMAPDRVHVVPMGVPALETGEAPRKFECREELGIPCKTPLVLFFGNIRPYKGVDVLVSAFRSVLREVPEARLAIVGQPWRGARSVAAEITDAGIEHATITRLTYVPTSEVDKFLAAADVVVFPYRHFDAQSAAAADAVAAGRPIIVSDVGGLPDFVRDRRAVVPAGDPASLAAALIDVLNDDAWRTKLESDAALVGASLSWDSVAAATARVYERALHRAIPTGRVALALTAHDEREHEHRA